MSSAYHPHFIRVKCLQDQRGRIEAMEEAAGGIGASETSKEAGFDTEKLAACCFQREESAVDAS